MILLEATNYIAFDPIAIKFFGTIGILLAAGMLIVNAEETEGN